MDDRPIAPMSSDKLRQAETIEQAKEKNDKLSIKASSIRKGFDNDKKHILPSKVNADDGSVAKSKIFFTADTNGANGAASVSGSKSVKKTGRGNKKVPKIRSKSAGISKMNDQNSAKLPSVVAKNRIISSRHVQTAPAASRSVNLPIISTSKSAQKNHTKFTSLLHSSMDSEHENLIISVAHATGSEIVTPRLSPRILFENGEKL
jgi:hypothetical protein